ncbi:KR domain-containing protein [Actinosynnema sp. NPDC053489]|uniref:KR domain-containing protein n=1 Tax=Actinosynnema sp. NPDC053489 TaxID=3363916 RepID=UPI0037CB1AD9
MTTIPSTPPPVTRRHAVREITVPPAPVRAALPPLPPRTLVLTTTRDLAGELRTRLTDEHSFVLPLPESGPVWDRDAFAALLPPGLRHIRVVASAGDAREGGDDLPEALVALHEVAFLAAQRMIGALREEGTLGVVLLDAFGAGVGSPARPVTGLFTGLLKCAAWETDRAQVFGVLTDAADLTTALDQLAVEYRCGRRFPHALYRGNRRSEERFSPVGSAGRPPVLDENSVVVAVGGSRGLTTQIVNELARTTGATFFIMGSTDLDALPAEVFEGDDEHFTARRPEFLRKRRQEDPQASPADLGRQFEALVHAREAKRSLAELSRLTGPDRCHYLVCDATDPTRVREAAAAVLADHAAVDLLLFSAVVSRPRSLEHKAQSDFRHVRDVKVRGHQNLRAAFGDRVRTWCNFGSVVGSLGLPGDVDYASANDYLAAAARHRSTRSPDREFTIAWTWWKESGFSSRPLAGNHMRRSGWLTGISDSEGVGHFFAELGSPGPGRALVALLGPAERATYDRVTPGLITDGLDLTSTAAGAGFYLDGRATEAREPHERSAVWTRRLEPDGRDAYLAGHRVRGVPTMAGAQELEMMAEAALALVPGGTVTAFEDVRYHSFLRCRPGRPAAECEIEVELKASHDGTARVTASIRSRHTRPGGRQPGGPRLHAEADVLLTTSGTSVGHTGPGRPLPFLDGARPVLDPYYRAAPYVELGGVYASTSDLRLLPWGSVTTARLRPVNDTGPGTAEDRAARAALAEYVVPSLLIDALTRVVLHDPEHPHRLGLGVPLGYSRVTLHTGLNDLGLDRRYGTGITLYRVNASNRAAATCLAVGPGAEALVTVEDPRLGGLAWVPEA